MHRWKRSLGVLPRHSVLTRCTLRGRSSEDAKKPNPHHRGSTQTQGNAGFWKGLRSWDFCQADEPQKQTRNSRTWSLFSKMIDNFNTLMWARFYWMPFFLFLNGVMAHHKKIKNPHSEAPVTASRSSRRRGDKGKSPSPQEKTTHRKEHSKCSPCNQPCFPLCDAVGPDVTNHDQSRAFHAEGPRTLGLSNTFTPP